MEQNDNPKPKRGRPVGSKNRRSQKLQEKLSRIIEKNIDEIEALLFSERMSDKARGQLYVDLLAYCIPKQASTSMEMRLQALANSPQFDDLFDTLVSQHERRLKQESIPLAIPVSSSNNNNNIQSIQPIDNAIQETTDTKGEDRLPDEDIIWSDLTR
jgi:hypothetical protein